MVLSIIVTAYNLDRYIEECIESLIFDEDSYEIIVVNDGSFDNTLGVLLRLSCNYGNIRILNQENKGVGAARNLGLAYASGEYIWFVDGDDVVFTANLQKAIKLLRDCELDVLGFSFNLVDEKGRESDWLNLNPVFNDSKISNGEDFYLHNVQYNYIWQYIIRRAILVKNGLNFITPYKMQDYEFLPRMMYCVKRVKSFTTPLVKYRQRLNSAVNSDNDSERLFFYESMIVVYNCIDCFKEEVEKKSSLYKGLEKRCEDLNQMLYLDFLNSQFSKEEEIKLYQKLKFYKLFPFRKIKGFSYKMNLRLNFYRILLNFDPFLFKKIIRTLN
ncbi:glycosyltransferase [Litoribacter populi]|uniref:glycosyltransferase n=1 Tax=Litoribacter populi TaxID=2598460 RepID=UPI00117D0193|nr:glycosyltransferase [Litoribacter populi]